MPAIFSKNHKFKLIEYGSSQQGLSSMAEMKDKAINFFQSIIKK